MTPANKDWAFSSKVREHFFHPRNLWQGEDPQDAGGVGMVGSPACGDVMKMWIWVEGDKIKDCRWQTFGCASAIASTSILSEMVIGMPLSEALRVRPSDIVESLEGLPERKIHCSVLGDQALRAAIYDYYKKSGQSAKIPRDELMCGCKNVLKSDLLAAYAAGADTYEKLQEKTGCGTVCGKCEGKVRDFVKTLEH